MYTVIIAPRCVRELRKIERGDKAVHQDLIEAISALKHDPRPPGSTNLGGRTGLRIRVRGYRVIYTVADDQLRVRVLRAGSRGDVYKGSK